MSFIFDAGPDTAVMLKYLIWMLLTHVAFFLPIYDARLFFLIELVVHTFTKLLVETQCTFAHTPHL